MVQNSQYFPVKVPFSFLLLPSFHVIISLSLSLSFHFQYKKSKYKLFLNSLEFARILCLGKKWIKVRAGSNFFTTSIIFESITFSLLTFYVILILAKKWKTWKMVNAIDLKVFLGVEIFFSLAFYMFKECSDMSTILMFLPLIWAWIPLNNFCPKFGPKQVCYVYPGFQGPFTHL